MARTSVSRHHAPCGPAALRLPDWARRLLYPVLGSPAPPLEPPALAPQPEAAPRGQTKGVVPPIPPRAFKVATRQSREPLAGPSNRKGAPTAHAPDPAKTTAPDTPISTNIS